MDVRAVRIFGVVAMRPVTVVVFGCVAVLAAASARRVWAEVPGFVRDADWVQVRSAHFRVLTDAGLGVARGTADKLERFADGLGRLNPGLAVTPASMATVIVLRDQSELEPFKPAGAENTDAFCQMGEDGERLVINGSSSSAGGVSPVLHECVHFLLAAHFPAVPLWLDEGLAEYYSTCRFHPATVEFGQPDLPTARWIKGHTPMGIETMFAMNAETSAYRHDNETQFLFYSEAYLITHYLQSAGGSTTGRFDAYLAALRRGARPLPAFHEIFPDSVWAPIAAAVARYPDEIEFQRVRSVSAGTPTPGAERALSHAEALTAFGDLELASLETTAAGEYYAAALAADPRWAPAMAGSGLVAEAAERTAEADAAYGGALAADGSNPVVLDGVARGLMWRIRAKERAGAPDDSVVAVARRALALYRRALGADANDLDALGGRGLALFTLQDVSDSVAVDGLARAVDARPRRAELAYALAELRALEGRIPEAVQLLRHRVAAIVPPSQAERMTRRAADLESGAGPHSGK
jgi:tetratricopeptide (TPR) repeat protein